MKTRPGHFIPSSLPNRKMTIRWYSAMIFIAEDNNSRKNTITIIAMLIMLMSTIDTPSKTRMQVIIVKYFRRNLL